VAIDPGMMTDATGDGMAGATDVSLNTQRNLMETYYNGSKPCLECGLLLQPQDVLQGRELCPKCQNRQDTALVKNRMVAQ
jgi:hypothetical protein